MGALPMLLAILMFFFLPWLDRSPVKSIRYRGGLFRFFFAIFTVSFLRTDVPRPAAGGGAVRDAGAHLHDRRTSCSS